MARRLLPALVGLGLGFVLLASGLVRLLQLFGQERQDDEAQLDARTRALEQLASAALQNKLAQRLRDAIPRLQDALGDPLMPADGLYVFLHGRQYLPRWESPSRTAPDSASDAHAHIARGESPAATQAPGLKDRFERLTQVETQASLGNDVLALTLADDLLRYHGAHPLPFPDDLVALVVLTERMGRLPALKPTVITLLREGLAEDAGGSARSGGIQRDVLRRRPQLSEKDFRFLVARVAELSRSVSVPTSDFLARAQEAPSGILVFPPVLPGPTLVGRRWYVEPHGGGVRGMAVDLSSDIEAILRDLTQRGVLEPRARLEAPALPSIAPADALVLRVVVPSVIAAREALGRRYAAKALLTFVCGLLAVGLVVLAVVLQTGRLRFLELKEAFVATVSHELRTPLASVRILAETLETRLGTQTVASDYPARIVQAVDGLHFLVENILSFQRLAPGRGGSSPQLVPLEDVVARLPEDLAHLPQPPPRVDAILEGAEVWGDPNLLRLLFANLGRNACLYNRRMPVDIRLRVHPAAPRGWTVLFSDNGIGIPEAQWEAIFEDFVRFERPGLQAPGSGLGLALCRRIMTAQGGSIRVATSGPEGTTFALRFQGEPP